jgi:hypothetical protein
MMDEMTPRQELRYAMSNISEHQWCAGWYSGLEYLLWDLVTGKIDKVGHMTTTEAKHVGNYLGELSRDAGGWWAWGESGEVAFIKIGDWEDLVAVKDDEDPPHTFAKAEWGEWVVVGVVNGMEQKVRRPLNDIATNSMDQLGVVAVALHDRIAALESAHPGVGQREAP